MAVQQDPEGDQMESRVAIVGAMQVLDRQVLKWEPGSKEAKYILKARKALTRVAGGIDARYYTALITAGLKRLDRKTKETRAAEPAAPGKESLYAVCLSKFRDAARKDDLLAAADISAPHDT